MTAKLDILFSVAGQSIYFDAPEGRPSSVVSVAVYEDHDGDTGTGESATTGAASIESVSLTVSAASGVSEADPTRIQLASVTGLVRNRRYLATNAYGQTEWIEVERIDSVNDDVYAQHALVHDYAASDTLASTRMTIALDSTWIADTNNISHPLCPRPRYRVVWTYVVGGTTYRAASWFDVVRYPYTTTVTALDVDRLSNGWLSRLSAEQQLGQGEDVIDEALQQVKLDLWERDLAAYALRNGEVLTELIKRKAVTLVHEQAYAHGGLGRAQLDLSRRDYWDRLAGLVEARKAQIQINTDGAGGTPSSDPVWRR